MGNVKKLLTLAIVVGLSQPLAAQATQARVVHHFSPTWTLIQHGDTLISIRHTRTNASPSSSALDTAVFVFRGDSAIRVRPGSPTPVSAWYAQQLRRAIAGAELQEDIERKLGRPLQSDSR